MDIMGAMKKPWVKYTVIGIVALGVIWIIYKNIGSTSSASSGLDSNGLTAAQEQANASEYSTSAQLQEQQNSVSAASASQASSQTYNLTLDAQQATEALQIDQLNDTTSITEQQNNINGQISMANISSQNIQDQLNAQTTQEQNSLNATVSLANINAGLQTTISNNQTSVANNQTAAAVQIAGGNDALAENASNNAASTAQMGQIASMAAMAMMVFA